MAIGASCAIAGQDESEADRWNRAGVVAALAGRYDEATLAFRAAINGVNGAPLTEAPSIDAIASADGFWSTASTTADLLSNLGLALTMTGAQEEARSIFDRAAVIAPDLAAPWINAAALNISRGEREKALANLSEAETRKGALGQIVRLRADCLIGLDRLSEAENQLEKYVRDRPKDAKAQFMLARIKSRTGKLRESQRALAKALASGPEAIGASRRSSSGEGLVGGINAGRASVDFREPSSNGAGVRFMASTDRLQVEDRSAASLHRDSVEVAATGKKISAYASFTQTDAGRPGSTTSIAGITSDPNAYSILRQSYASVDVRSPLGSLDVAWHGVYRRTQIDSSASNFDDTDSVFEFRIDRSHFNFGYALAHLSRNGAGSIIADPSEQMLTAGNRQFWTAYGLYGFDPVHNVHANAGFVLAWNGVSRTIHPIALLEYPIADARSIRFGLQSRTNEAVSDLIPESILAPAAQSNPIDRTQDSGTNANRSPLLFGQEGRQSTAQLVFPWAESNKFRHEFVAFHHELTDVLAQGGDPRVANVLILTPLTSATINGVTERATLTSGRWTTSAFMTLQSSSAGTTFQVFDAGAYPLKVPFASSDAPNVPNVQAGWSVDFRTDRAAVGVVMSYVGRRIHAVTSTSSGTPLTFFETADPALGLSVLAGAHINSRLCASLSIFNLTRTNFYPGYPGGTTFNIGFSFRF